MQYEELEFDLEPIFNEDIYYDKYLYIKNDINSLFKLPLKKIYLSFSLDILVQIEYQFDNTYFQEIKNILISLLGKNNMETYKNRLEWKISNIYIILEIPLVSDIFHLTVTDIKYFNYNR